MTQRTLSVPGPIHRLDQLLARMNVYPDAKKQLHPLTWFSSIYNRPKPPEKSKPIFYSNGQLKELN